MMKRILLALLLGVLPFVVQSQEIVRHGNRYSVGDESYASSMAFRGYLKNTNHSLFTEYNKGYKAAMTGWGLLAFGSAVPPVSTFMLMANQAVVRTNPQTGELVIHQAPPDLWFGGWLTCIILGAGAFCTSIPLLGVGYHKMHTAVDAYSIRQTQNVSAYWTINMKSDGIGLAYHF